MRKQMIFLLLSVLPLVACGGGGNSESKKTKNVSHYFDKPYVCSYEGSYKSKKTGETKTYTSEYFYHPEKQWHISLSGIVANLYTPTHRYDGVNKTRKGNITKAKFMTAWLSNKPENPKRAMRQLSKVDKKNCKLMSDTSLFDIDYLDRLEIMNGEKEPDLDKVMTGAVLDEIKVPKRFKDAIKNKVNDANKSQ